MVGGFRSVYPGGFIGIRTTRTSIASTRACQPGATNIKRSATPEASMPATRTATASARSTSTRWRASVRCCALGCARIAASRRTSCRSISVSSSSCTTRVDAAKPCSARSSPACLRDGPGTTPEPDKSRRSSAAATSGRRARSARPAPAGRRAASHPSPPAACARHQDSGLGPGPACRAPPTPSGHGRSCSLQCLSPPTPQQCRRIRQHAPRPRHTGGARVRSGAGTAIRNACGSGEDQSSKRSNKPGATHVSRFFQLVV